MLGKGYGSWNSNDGVTSQGFGTVLRFDGPGSPRYIALKPVDSTGFDTIKIHMLLVVIVLSILIEIQNIKVVHFEIKECKYIIGLAIIKIIKE